MKTLPFQTNIDNIANINQNTLTMHNSENDFSSFFSVDTPFAVTYEYCSGISSSDYLNIVVLSPNGCNYGTYSMDKYRSLTRKRCLHSHDYYELMLVLDGELLHKIEDKEYSYKLGYACLINRNVRHTEVFTGAAKLLFIGLSKQLASEILEHYTIDSRWEEKKDDNSLLNFIRCDLSFSVQKEYLDFFPSFQNYESVKVLHDITDHLMTTVLSPDAGAYYTICGTLCRLIQYLTNQRYYHITQVKLNSRTDFLLFLRIRHLLEETNGRIPRRELESTLNYSGNYINKIVKKYTEMNLFDYSMTFCMERAEYLLKNTDQSINSIMSELNFTNPTHFYSLFKKKYALTPKEYRNKIKESK